MGCKYGKTCERYKGFYCTPATCKDYVEGDSPLVTDTFHYPGIESALKTIVAKLEEVAYGTGSYIPEAVRDAKYDLKLLKQMGLIECLN